MTHSNDELKIKLNFFIRENNKESDYLINCISEPSIIGGNHLLQLCYKRKLWSFNITIRFSFQDVRRFASHPMT